MNKTHRQILSKELEIISILKNKFQNEENDLFFFKLYECLLKIECNRENYIISNKNAGRIYLNDEYYNRINELLTLEEQITSSIKPSI